MSQNKQILFSLLSSDLHSTIGARPPRASHVAQKEQLPAVTTEITKLHSPWADTRISERSIYGMIINAQPVGTMSDNRSQIVSEHL